MEVHEAVLNVLRCRKKFPSTDVEEIWKSLHQFCLRGIIRLLFDKKHPNFAEINPVRCLPFVLPVRRSDRTGLWHLIEIIMTDFSTSRTGKKVIFSIVSRCVQNRVKPVPFGGGGRPGSALAAGACEWLAMWHLMFQLVASSGCWREITFVFRFREIHYRIWHQLPYLLKNNRILQNIRQKWLTSVTLTSLPNYFHHQPACRVGLST